MPGLYTNQYGMIFILVPRAKYKFNPETVPARLKDKLIDNLRQKAAAEAEAANGDRIGRYRQLFFNFYKPEPPAVTLPEPWPIGATWHPLAEPIESPISRREYYIIEPDALTLSLLLHKDTPPDMLQRFFNNVKRKEKLTAEEENVPEFPTFYDEDGREYVPDWRTPQI